MMTSMEMSENAYNIQELLNKGEAAQIGSEEIQGLLDYIDHLIEVTHRMGGDIILLKSHLENCEKELE